MRVNSRSSNAQGQSKLQSSRQPNQRGRPPSANQRGRPSRPSTDKSKSRSISATRDGKMNSSKSQMSRQKSSTVKSSNPPDRDSVYSRSYKYKNNIGQQSSTRKRNQSKSPAPKKEVRKASKAPAHRKSSGSAPRKPKNGATDVKFHEKELREILEMYFEYIIENLHGKTNKMHGISIGKILTKRTFEKEK